MVLVEDSSSLSVSFILGEIVQLKIAGLKQTLRGVLEITPDAGSAFFLRILYLSQHEGCEDCVLEEDFFPGAEFEGEKLVNIMHASLVYSVEAAAMSYLARAEQSRFGLTQKLLKKGMDKNDIALALDYLESEHLLDDRRFAGAWLRNRFITHSEGRIKLTAELSSRGVKKEAIKAALDDFFCEHTELELCSRALSKLRRICSNDEKNYASLQRLGFSYKTIQKAVMEKF